MPSNYDQIRLDNIRRRGEEFDDIGHLISEQLYSDRSHFVYELLQNAEDALERRFRDNTPNNFVRGVKFLLFKDRLEFRHFGQPFDDYDVRGISDVLKGTKSDDRTQIGKFGIGFKSVYAFTATPEVHSGDEHFAIKRYIRPEAAKPYSNMEQGETLFIFPFDHIGLSADEAFDLILRKLRGLGPRVLLFLNRINEIEWCAEPVGEKGQYLKDSKKREKASQVTVIGEHNGEDEEENWLVFERPISDINDSDTAKVEIAFRLYTDEKYKIEEITKIKDSPLVVYFPTEKPTRFGFLIQGPYRTTPSRDNIPKEDDWNKNLVQKTAALLIESLQHLKKMGLLNIAVLESLPIRMDDFPEDNMFYPIADTVRDTLMSQELLLTDSGNFVSADNAKLARGAELRKLLNSEQLRSLFQAKNNIEWLSGKITQDRAPDLRLYLMEQLKIEEVRPEKFADILSNNFIEEQSDEWIIDFYSFLVKDRPELWKKPGATLRKRKILRLENNLHVIPFKDDGTPNAYLPSSVRTNFPTIKEDIYANEKAAEFLKSLGIIEPDLFAEIIEFILPKYAENKTVSYDENIEDLIKIRRLLTEPFQGSSSNSLAKLRILLGKLGAAALEDHFSNMEPRKIIPSLLKIVLPSVRLLRSFNVQTTTYKAPKDLYSNSPELHHYFQNNPEGCFICDDYPNELFSLFSDLGVNQEPKVTIRNTDSNGFVIISKTHGYHRRGINGFDPDIKVDGLENALANPSIETSEFIWNKIAQPHSNCIRGIIERSSRQTYENSQKEALISDVGRLLIDMKWLPKLDEFVAPSDISLDDLPVSFIRDEKLADQLEMKKDVIAELAEQAGISPEMLAYAKLLEQNPDIRELVDKALNEKKEKPTFPTRPVSNRDRRQKKISEQLADTPKKKFEPRARSVRTTEATQYTRIWLKEQYTNDAGQMVCQICTQEMPFRKRDNEHYFEAVEALSKTHFTKEHEAQFLALCPLCAAMYKEFIKRDEDAMEIFKNNLINAGGLEVSITLGEIEKKVQFVQTHYLDLKTVLGASDATI
jgi:hypothetical protein